MAPYRDIVESELIPPAIEHRLIEAQDAFFGDAGWWRRELLQAIEDAGALRVIYTRQQMPQSERVAHSGLGENGGNVVGALLCARVLEVETRERSAEGRRRILKIGSAGPDFRSGRAGRPGGDEGLAAIQLETDPSQRRAHETCAGIVHVQGVGAAQVHGDGGGSVHDELSGGRPDVGVNGAAIEGDSFQVLAHAEEAQASAGVDIDLANFGRLQAGAGMIVGLKNLADRETRGAIFSRDGVAINPWASGEARDIPTRDRRLRVTVAEH